MLKKIREFFKKASEKGQGVVEYALLLSVAALIALALLANNGLGDKIVDAANQSGDNVKAVTTKVQTTTTGANVTIPDGSST